MATELLTVAKLLTHFAVRGHFYRHQRKGYVCDPWYLRDRLEIYDHTLSWPQVRDGNADLVAVMMNPGGSRPLSGALFTSSYGDGWCDALPDRTQYQLMKLALGTQNIRHIRVINLSDLRTPKSAELFATLPQLGGWHSIFDKSRRRELKRVLGESSTPVLLAWGLAPQLRPLAETALSLLQEHPKFGITDDGVAYRHPLPQRYDLQREWLEQVAAQMREQDARS